MHMFHSLDELARDGRIVNIPVNDVNVAPPDYEKSD
jgi:hypothetical protein